MTFGAARRGRSHCCCCISSDATLAGMPCVHKVHTLRRNVAAAAAPHRTTLPALTTAPRALSVFPTLWAPLCSCLLSRAFPSFSRALLGTCPLIEVLIGTGKRI